MRKPGAELGAVVPAQHAISGLEVSSQQVCVPKVVFEPCQGFCFTSLEAMHSLQGRQSISSDVTRLVDCCDPAQRRFYSTEMHSMLAVAI